MCQKIPVQFKFYIIYIAINTHTHTHIHTHKMRSFNNIINILIYMISIMYIIINFKFLPIRYICQRIIGKII